MTKLSNGLRRGVMLTFACAALSTQAQVPRSEREALIDLYEATGGAQWVNDLGWLGEAGSECDWHGVSCFSHDDGESRIDRISLPANGLAGALPGSLVELGHLALLNLSDNDLHGSIPEIYSEFPALHHFDLSRNALTGSIPGGLLHQDAHLYLSDNRLTGYTDTDGFNTGARIVVELSGNPIGALPPASWRSSNAIASLSLNRTGIRGELDFNHAPWPGLDQLELADNEITRVAGIDANTLLALRQLDLSGNGINDQWPVSGQTLPELGELDMTGNDLSAPPPDGLSGHPRLREVRLSDNALNGADLGELFALRNGRMIHLSGNPLQALPSELPGPPADLYRLMLAESELSEGPPSWFGDLDLTILDLSGNQVGGGIDPWLEAMRSGFTTRLNLSRNQFEGALPDALAEMEFSADGLGLCWNRFEAPFDAEMEAYLEGAHRGGDLAACNDRELYDIDPTVSGSWYNPDHSGMGYTLMLLENGQLLHYWFGYPLSIDAGHEKQMWSLGMVAPEGFAAIFRRSLVPHGGQFEQGLGNGRATAYGDRVLEAVRLGPDSLSVYSSWFLQGRNVVVDPPPPRIHERLDHSRLTALAGTTCDNQSPFQASSGAWFNPERSGEGFVLEVLPDDRGVVYWFTYTPDGSGRQAWMIGSGSFEYAPIDGAESSDTLAATLEIDSMLQPIGAYIGPEFDSESIEDIDWGSLTMTFDENDAGQISYESNFHEYGSGSYPIERLARAKLAECD